ncbi:uncharacterized protein [Manis javanica]|uniref:uncharacterized protein isoform X2 n=1 Tax=Manis javanica TaxID=9974 RepID=UPI003C6D8E8B
MSHDFLLALKGCAHRQSLPVGRLEILQPSEPCEALTGQRIQWSSTGENDRHKEKGKTPMPPGFQLLRRSLWLPSQVSGIPEFPQRIMVDLPRFLHAWKMV